MSEFGNDCDYVIFEGGPNEGVVMPVAHGINMVQFHIKGGGLVTYRRTIPARFRGDHIVFRFAEDE